MPARKPAEPQTERGERLERALRERGLTQNALIRRAKLKSSGSVSRMISGSRSSKTLDPDVWKALATALNVNLEWLIVGSGPMRGPRDDAADTARRTLNVLDEAIDVVLAEPDTGTLSKEQWLARMLQVGDALRREREERPQTMVTKRRQQEFAKEQQAAAAHGKPPDAANGPPARRRKAH